jgi:hypothetical protein
MGEAFPDEAMRWHLAEKFGWTLDYIDSLSLQDLIQYESICDGKAHAQDSLLKKK